MLSYYINLEDGVEAERVKRELSCLHLRGERTGSRPLDFTLEFDRRY